MNQLCVMTIAVVFSAGLTGAATRADETPSTTRPKTAQLHHTPPAIPAPEPMDTPAASTLSPQATTLSPPVTLTYSGSSNAITVTDSGTGRGISSTVTDSNSGSSALFGSTVGTGAGLTGYNSGSSGPGGKFEVTNAGSAQAGAFASTNGTGPAILGTVTNTNSDYPAIYGQNTIGDNGVGVEGDGGFIGVTGSGKATGVYGTSTSGSGVEGESDSGYGVTGFSANSYAGYFEGPVAADSYVTLSDKNAKTDFASVDNGEILDKVSRLPITTWDFKTDKKQRRHVGPMAQDFHAQFGLGGDDDKHINLGDMAGVTLAAVQELNSQVKRQDVEMRQKDAEIAELRAQLAVHTKALANMTEAFSARLSSLEQRQGTSLQTAALK